MVAEPARAGRAAFGCLGLGLLALIIALGRGSRLRKATLGLSGILAYQALLWGISLVGAGVVGPALLAGAMVILAGGRIRKY